MKVLAGYKYHIYVGDRELKNVVQITIGDDKVQVDSDYAYRGFNGGDLVGISTSTYDKDEVTIVRSGEHELHSKEDEE